MPSIEYECCLLALSEKLELYGEANQRRVWALSKRFEERVFIMSIIEKMLKDCRSYTRKDTDERRAVNRKLNEVKGLRASYVGIAELGPHVKGEKRPSMRDLNDRWFTFCEDLEAFVRIHAAS